MKSLDYNNYILGQDMNEILNCNIDIPEYKNCTICITGATGMIASYLVLFFLYLNEKYNTNITILAVVRNENKAKKLFEKYLDNIKLKIIVQDISKELSIGEKINYIIHAASLASPQYYGLNPVETIVPNSIATYNLLELAKKQENFLGFLFFSSGSVYGRPNSVKDIKEEDIGTLDYLYNGNSYAESKRFGEMLCHAYSSEYGIRAISARIHHTYAPTMDVKNDKRAFSSFVNSALKNEDIVLKSNGEAKRAFCYITDTIRALLLLMMRGNAGECYNIGNPDEYITINDLAKTIIKQSGYNARLIHEINNSELTLSPEANSKVIPVNIEKLKKLGWKPFINVDEGFLRVLDFLKDNNN